MATWRRRCRRNGPRTVPRSLGSAAASQHLTGARSRPWALHRAAARPRLRGPLRPRRPPSTSRSAATTRSSPWASASSPTPSACATPSTPTTSRPSTTPPASSWPTRRAGHRPQAALGRLLVLPGPLHDRLRPRPPALARREGAGRPGRRRLLDAPLAHRRDRRRRSPASSCGSSGCSTSLVLLGILGVFTQMRRGPSTTRPQLEDQLNKRGLHEPLPRRPDQERPQAVAHLPDRRALRARLRHRHRGRPARARRRRRGVQPAVLRDPGAADPVRGRHVPGRHRRRRVHERRLRLGLRPPGPQGLLQHHDHQHLGRRRADHRHRRAARRCSPTGPTSPPGRSPRRRRSRSTTPATASSGSSCSSWVVALAVWRFGRIEERWSSDLAG